MRQRRSRREDGAVAVIVGITVVMLFSMAALAVDLGNAFARKADVQAQADFAALAGAARLSSASAKEAVDPAVIAVADYLTKNQPQDDSASSYPAPEVTATQLVDGDMHNGEVNFPADYQMTVFTPRARVDFGLASVMGFSEVDVAGGATVGLVSPGPVVPFFLPQACKYGDVTLKAGNYNPDAPTFTPSSSNGSSLAKIGSVDPVAVPGGGIESTLTIYGSNFSSSMTVDFHLEGATNRFPVNPAQLHPATQQDSNVPGQDMATTQIPSAVSGITGTWYIRISNDGGTTYSKWMASFEVGDPSPPVPGCGQVSTGDFGVLYSPRRPPATQLNDVQALNIAEGLDHDVIPFDTDVYSLPPQGQDSCQGNGGTPPVGAVNDKDPTRNDANCLNIQTGGNIPFVTSGIIAGGSTSSGYDYEGRLRSDSSICDHNGGTSPDYRLETYINNDVLSCFLKPGVTVGDVSSELIPLSAEGAISPEIYDSPRFMVVPIIDYPVNPQNGFYPIIGYVPVFLTEESEASQKGASIGPSTNGVLDDGTKIVSLRVIALNPLALPETAEITSGTIPYTGSGTKVVRLLD